MKTTESTGLPTIVDEEIRKKKNSGFIELTLKSTGDRVLFSLAHISLVTEPERSGCDVYYGDGDSYVVVRESYDEVRRLIEEAGNGH